MFKNSLSEAMTEALKEFIRNFIIGEIVTLTEVLGIIYLGINQDLGTFMIKWNVAGAVFAGQSIYLIKMCLLTALDKFGHEKKIKTPLDLRPLDALSNE